MDNYSLYRKNQEDIEESKHLVKCLDQIRSGMDSLIKRLEKLESLGQKKPSEPEENKDEKDDDDNSAEKLILQCATRFCQEMTLSAALHHDNLNDGKIKARNLAVFFASSMEAAFDKCTRALSVAYEDDRSDLDSASAVMVFLAKEITKKADAFRYAVKD